MRARPLPTSFRLSALTTRGLSLLGLLVLGLCLAAPAAAASAAQKRPASMQPGHVETFTVGSIKVYGIVDAATTFETTLLNPEFRLNLPQASFAGVVKTYLLQWNGKNVLVDTGWGSNGPKGVTLQVLKQLGIAPEAVTDILMTHLDADHACGLAIEGRATYPNATLHIARPEYEAWMAGTVKRPADKVALVKEKLSHYTPVLFNWGDIVLPGCTAVDAHGHTPGHTVFDLLSAGKQFSILGDIMHIQAVQLRFPRACTAYDMDQEAAIASRLATFRRLANTKVLVAGMHFPETGSLRLHAKGTYTLDRP